MERDLAVEEPNWSLVIDGVSGPRSPREP